MRRAFSFLIVVIIGAGIGTAWHFWPYQAGRTNVASLYRWRFSRPNGMAPAAFDGFLRACNNARIRPQRINQTIGDYPLSVGYHHRDGTLNFRGQKLDYTAAVDLEASDLTRPQLARFLEALAAQGFAAFYREKGKWRGHEHIHAIYAPLPMKWQLQSQVREWEIARRRAGKRAYHWQKHWRVNWR